MEASSENSSIISQFFMQLTQTAVKENILGNMNLTRLQAMALRLVNKKAGITMSTLADLIGITGSQLTRIVTTLEERGLVARTHNAENRRVVNVQATDQGRALFQTGMAQARKELEAQLATLSADQQAVLQADLKESIALMKQAGIFAAD